MLNRRNLGILVAICVICTVMPVFGQSRSNLKLNGSLVYGWGETIKLTKFENGKEGQTQVLYRKTGEQIEGLTKIDERKFLFAESLTNQIKMFDLKTGTVTRVSAGSGPTYLAQHGKLFFYRSEPGAMRIKLLVADWKDLNGSERVVDEGPFAITRHVVPIDDNQVLFLPRDSREVNVKIFDARTSETLELPLKGCVPKFWRTATEQLLCFDIERSRYVLASLDGKSQKHLNWPVGIVPALYLPDIDAALLGFEEGGDHGVAFYWFANDKKPRTKILLRQTIVGESDVILFGE